MLCISIFNPSDEHPEPLTGNYESNSREARIADKTMLCCAEAASVLFVQVVASLAERLVMLHPPSGGPFITAYCDARSQPVKTSEAL